jgi:hypothetical protein
MLYYVVFRCWCVFLRFAYYAERVYQRYWMTNSYNINESGKWKKREIDAKLSVDQARLKTMGTGRFCFLQFHIS